MARLRFLQAFEGFLVIALLVGLFSLRRAPLLPQLVGIAINLLWQYVTILAIRKGKQNLATQGQFVEVQARSRMKKLLPVLVLLPVMLVVLTGLFAAHVISPRVFGLSAFAAAVFAWAFLTRQFYRMRVAQR